MTHLRYFIPLIIEGNKSNIKSSICWEPSHKYNCPAKYLPELTSLSEEYNFNLSRTSEADVDANLPIFTVEGYCIQNFESKQKVVLTSNVDYHNRLAAYEEFADYIIFPSEYFKNKFPIPDSPKIVCLGSPKYDTQIDASKVKERFNLNESEKHCLIILPKLRDMNLINFKTIINSLRRLNYKIITKNREKEGYNLDIGDINLVDKYWYPHSTMDLIHVSDLVITFGSLAIKECLMLKTKMINFDVKPFKVLPELYEGNFCVDIKDKNYTEDDLLRHHSILQNTKDFQFDEYIKEFMFPPNSSKRILDFLINCDH